MQQIIEQIITICVLIYVVVLWIIAKKNMHETDKAIKRKYKERIEAIYRKSDAIQRKLNYRKRIPADKIIKTEDKWIISWDD